eukprot:3902013-Prymnesium_polylepis.1
MRLRFPQNACRNVQAVLCNLRWYKNGLEHKNRCSKLMSVDTHIGLVCGIVPDTRVRARDGTCAATDPVRWC